MKSLALQDLVKKIFSDEKTKTQFMSDPDSVISQFDLTEQEKKAVKTTFTHLRVDASGSTLAAVIQPMDTWY